MLMDLLLNSLPIGSQLGRREKLCDGSVLGKPAAADGLSPAWCRVDSDTLRCKRGMLQKMANSGKFDRVVFLDKSRSLAGNGVLGCLDLRSSSLDVELPCRGIPLRLRW